MPNEPNAYLAAIKQAGLGLSKEQCEAAASFAVILERENLSQNLTRIIGPEEFVQGHLMDVIQLFHVEQLGSRVLDVGSGSGVPGLLAAAIDLSPTRLWFLADSEKSKAEYLKAAAQELHLPRVVVLDKRVDEIIDVIKPDCVIARAVGKVEKIMAWISDCSTWNNLILFKSVGWNDEWSEAQKNRFGKKLTITQSIEYSSQGKYRLLINLIRKS